MTNSSHSTVLAFVAALNRHDLGALGALMSPDHSFTDASGQRSVSRQASLGHCTAYLEQHPRYRITPSQILLVDGAALCFARAIESDLPPQAHSPLPLLCTATLRDGQVAEWRVRPDTPGTRLSLRLRQARSVWLDVQALARELDTDLQALEADTAPNRDRVRKPYHQRLRTVAPGRVMQLAFAVKERFGHRGTACQLIHHHAGALASLDQAALERLGKGINSWGSVDGFAAYVAGVAWREGQIGDGVVHRWARSPDLWWRRAALVCTVALNTRARGGRGDPSRTLDVCRLLVDDDEDMVVKAMSWALRELVYWDREAVEAFLAEHEDRLAARVKREVRNKLRTGLKNP